MNKGDLVIIKDTYWREELRGQIYRIRKLYLANGGDAAWLSDRHCTGILLENLELVFTI